MKRSFLETEKMQNLVVNLQTKFFFADDKEEEKEEEKDNVDRKGGRIEV